MVTADNVFIDARLNYETERNVFSHLIIIELLIMSCSLYEIYPEQLDILNNPYINEMHIIFSILKDQYVQQNKRNYTETFWKTNEQRNKVKNSQRYS